MPGGTSLIAQGSGPSWIELFDAVWSQPLLVHVVEISELSAM